jgi:acyl transferase domain-containing protein
MIRLQACAEPIAIVGIGCRFPGGADTWQEFWHLLESGMDAISETPAERWSLKKFYAPQATKPGKTQSRWGGYVRGIENFDPQLFGISPREAASMDPQQRMLLEVAFRALEDAGQPLERVAGQSVSVFVGISSFDYAVAGLSAQDPGVIDAYSNTGGSSSIAANRISYCFDLRGPSVAVDTACSSSLVAVHLACESLWRGEVPMALAGGVNALLLPDFYVAFSQLGVLSPDGRCKSFDARANGYVRSEGAGMVLLKPLATALRDKDPIYAVIRGTALNQDGRTPGMTVPSQAAQEELIRAACRNAGVMPQEIEYVEAHGTGTPVGDPIEAAAIGAVIGRARTAHQPCTIGSVKTNIGHLEAGAGIASLIKVALALHHRRIPAHLHFQQANPAIDWEGLHLRIPRVAHDWQSTGKRLAGINGFGYGGANAHVIVEQAPQGKGLSTSGTVASLHRGGQRAPSRTVLAESTKGRNCGLGAAGKAAESHFSAPVVLPLSARTPQALSMWLQQWLQWLERHGEDFSLAEVAGFLAHRRSHHACRVALSATNLVDMLSELRNLAANSAEDLALDNSPAQLGCGPVFVCSGQGPQWWGMGRGLLKYSATFRSLIKRCDVEFAKYGKWSLLKELTRSEHESQMHKTSLAQPSIFAIQVALAAMWESWGVRPTAVVGHSVGEIAAAYLTGGLSFEDAARVAFHRGRTMDLASSQGAMLAAGLAPHEVPQWLDGIETEVSVAAINGPTSVTISGAAQAIDVLSQRLEQAGVFCRRLAVEYAFHSPQMEPVREELLKALASIEPRATHTQFISTVTGHTLPGTELGAEYWWRNVRQSVRFSQAMDCLASQGYALAIEIGPHPVLAYAIHECFQAAGRAVTSLPSLNRQQDDLQCITQSLGKLYALGVDIQWSGFYNQPERRLEIPLYPFQSQPCWSESLESRVGRLTAEVHPLLGCPMLSPQPQWQQRIDLKLQSYLSAHRVRGAAVYPAAAILETALAAVVAISQEAQPAPTGLHLQRVRLHQPCVLGDNHPQWIQTSLDLQRRQLQLNFRPCDESHWSPLATLEISSQPTNALQADLESGFAERVTQIRNRCTDHFDAQRLYDHCRQIGLQYGQAFQGVVRGQRRAGEAMLEINLPLSDLESQDALQDYLLHPRLLDSCFHGMIAADPNFDHTVDGLYLPAEIQQVVWIRRPTQRLTAIVVCPYKSSQLMRCDVEIYDEAGRLCMLLRGFESRRVSGGQALETTADLLYGYEWIEHPLQSTASLQSPPGRHWILFMDQTGLGCKLSAQLTGRGERVVEIYHDASRTGQTRPGGGRWVDPSSTADLQRVLQEAAEELEQRVDELVYLWGLDAPRVACLTADRLDESTLLTSLAPVRIVQAWEQWAGASPAGFRIVTSGAQSGDGQPDMTEVAQAPLIGLGRVVASEVNRLRTKLIDLAVELTDADIRSLTDELLTTDEEDEVRLRDGRRWVHRFHPQAGKPVSADVAAGLPCRLHVGHSAGIEELHYQVSPAPAPQAGEVEIAVVASGLNFSDVMKGLALYPGLPDGPVELGAECSGTISRVGPDSRWAVGDEVIAIAPGSFATHVIVSQDLVARKPRQLTHQQAAGIPIAFLTAHYALHECAGLQPGESVLIHAASGGVGLAAMQLSRLIGAKILATAGNEEKRRLVGKPGPAW